MHRILILGDNTREIVLAKKLFNEGNDVYVMSKKLNPCLKDSKVVFYNCFFSEELVKKIRPDIVFAFSNEYVMNKQINDKIHSICKESLVIIPKAEYCTLEKDKMSIRKIIGSSMTSVISIVNKEKVKQCLDEGQQLFIRESNGRNTKCYICKNSTDLDRISFAGNTVCSESYFNGQNVTVTTYVNRGKFVLFPTVFDFPFIETSCLIKTGGIRCNYNMYNESIGNLDKVVMEIIKKIKIVINDDFTGFLALQLMVENNNYYFVEVDIRPGEPEFLNVINAVDEDITEIFMNPKDLYKIKSKNIVSSSIAIANKKYPYYNQVQFNLNKDLNNDFGSVYWSKSEINKNIVKNYDSGRVAFIYFEGDNIGILNQHIKSYKDEYMLFFEKNNLVFFN